ncbi:MAG: hypothetical protein IJ916_04305 [Paludibacteraceae bacterium]|nr:hypothetical protein [Paludibacteraceae bacterium]
MKKRTLKRIIIMTLSVLLLTSCDSGDIYENFNSEAEGLSCTATVSFINTSTWPVDYQIVLAAFNQNDYPLITKGISKPAVGDTIQLSLNGIPENCTEISIALLNKSKRLVNQFFTHVITNEEREKNLIQLTATDLNLLDYSRIQHQFFSNCINCHGASEKAAAGLFLTDGKSYDAIVNKTSSKDSTAKIVLPGFPEKSFIIRVLEGKAENLHYDHTNVSFNSETEDIELLKAWINQLK